MMDLAILPIGANDNNGMHSSLGTDTTVETVVARRLGELTGFPVAAIPWGNSTGQLAFPGTLHVRCFVISERIRDLCRSLTTNGFQRILVIKGHITLSFHWLYRAKRNKEVQK